MEIRLLCNCVRQTAFAIHAYHGNGHVERVYENALVHRLRKLGLRVDQQRSVRVYDADGAPIGDYVTDLFIEQALIVELKTVKTLTPEHQVQLLAYLKSTRIEHGLLINFGSYRFQIRKYVLRANPSPDHKTFV